MKRLIFAFILECLFISGLSYSIDELRSLDFLPRYSVLNSSCIGGDSGALFINPAGLSSVDRMSAGLSTTNFQDIGFFGFSALPPVIGGVFALDIYNTSTENAGSKRGFAFGYGREFFGCLALGAGIKTVSDYAFDTRDGLFFDAGIIFSPNESLNLDFFRNSFINNKLFISFAVQDLGHEPSTTTAEEQNLRLGLLYNLDIIWTKFFVEKMFLSRNEPFVFGLEFNPSPDILKMFFLRGSYEIDSRDVRLGFGVHGEDAMADFSYSALDKRYFLSFNVYFEKSRREMSVENYNEGVVLYNEALDEEKSGNPAMEKFLAADVSVKSALSRDRSNVKASLLKEQIEGRLSDYKAQNLSNAQIAENKKDPVGALIYYNRAALLADNPAVETKISNLITNQTVINFIINSKIDINSATNARKFIAAKKEISRLLLVLPKDRDVLALREGVSTQLKNIAEVYYRKAQSFYDRYLLEDCMSQARNALVYEPDLVKAQDLYNLAQTDLYEKQSSRKAYELFGNKNYIGALYMANRVLARDSESQDSAALKSRILKIFRDNEKEYLNEGISLYNNAEYDKAIEDFSIVLLIDPGNNTASDYIGRASTKEKAVDKLSEIQEQ